MAADGLRKLIEGPAPEHLLAEENPYSAVVNYYEECRRYGIDPKLGLLDPLAYALEVVSRMGSLPEDPNDKP